MVDNDVAADDDVVDNGVVVVDDVTIPCDGSYVQQNSLRNHLYLGQHYDDRHFGSLNRHPCFLSYFPCIKYNLINNYILIQTN